MRGVRATNLTKKEKKRPKRAPFSQFLADARASELAARAKARLRQGEVNLAFSHSSSICRLAT